MKITILGAGTWGLSLASVLAKKGLDVTVWSALPKEIDALSASGCHPHLPSVTLPSSIRYTKDIADACRDADTVFFVVPSAFMRKTAEAAAPFLEDGTVLVSAAKGLEPHSLMVMTEVLSDTVSRLVPALRFSAVALSGPTHAEEVVVGQPTSIVSACEDEAVATRVATLFTDTCMRVYTNTDVRGVEIAGALKNIIALAAGINRGMGYGDNASAMLITRGVAEITRLGLAIGCRRRTFMGLAGIGDLIVTCTSRHSRNNRCGELIGSGKTYEEASAEIGMVVEGYYALEAAMELAEKANVEMPITKAVYDIIKRGIRPNEAIHALMNRDFKSELDT